MKTTRIPLLLCALLAAGAAVAEDAKDAEAQPQGDDVLIATVNGTPYGLDLFRLFFLERLQQSQGQNSPELQEQAFNDFMSLVVASQEAARRSLEQDPDVGVAIELQRMKILSNAALASMAEEIEPTEDELKKAYEEVKENASQTEYKARHILVKDEEEAKKMIEELEGGADFGDLAREHSLGPTGKNGGELEWFDANQMVAPFSEAVAAMEVGSYTKTPVQTQFGWHVIELQDSRKAEPPSFEDAKQQLMALLKRQKLSAKLAEMRDGAMVELNEEVVKLKPTDDAAAKGSE
ncbi:peptidylprolyl isomerase [Thiocapsa roseopersicina]|uniref:peptidylprolyl isomerase n=1 Tax=Thiocapsa roseopersicina TaxID=1058 RepID=A0A1H2Q7M9_THIRO|nr:peptidylprolyl isomerase [Thiocapsa roseopersicina]SDW02704.1 peptidyl-prolyl cis-trans isomerase C [Thiocapsa roseopersicina]